MYRKKLLELGVPADLDGFETLNCAIELYKPMQRTLDIYDSVAKKLNITRSRAERNMRTAISKTGEIITVGQFIAKYHVLWSEE